MTTAIQDPPVKQAKIIEQVSSPAPSSGRLSRDILLRRYRQLKLKNELRNSTYRHLDLLYQSDPAAHDMQSGGDDNEIIMNVFFEIVNTMVDFKGIPPNMSFLPPNLKAEGKAYADTMEKLLYALWDFNELDITWPRVAFDLTLKGLGNMGILPNFDEKMVEYRRFTPRNFYPMMVGGKNYVKSYFYEDTISKDDVIERWGEKALEGAGKSTMWQEIFPDGSLDPDLAVTLEYMDDEYLLYFVMDKIVQVIPHKFGFCPAVVFDNIVKPDIVGGVSDVAVYETCQRYMGELISQMADIIAVNAEPWLVFKGENPTVDSSSKQINLGKDGDAKYLETSMPLDTVRAQLKQISDYIHDGTIPDTLYGRMESKGTIGSAPVLSGLQMKFMVKLNALYRRSGRTFQRLNTMALSMMEKLYKDKKIEYAGWRKNQAFDLEMYGKDIQAHKRHRVFWDLAATDPERHMVMQLQLSGAKLQSKYTTIEKMGGNADDEFELMRQEDIYEIRKQAALKMEMARLESRFQPKPVEETNRDVLSAAKGGKVYPAGEERPKPGRPATGQATGAGGPSVDPGQVAAALKAVKKLKGEVYLVDVADSIDIALTDKTDKATILQSPSMAPYKGSIVFVAVQPGQAREEWMRVR